MTAKFCGVGAPLAIAVKVLERLQLLPPVQRVGHRGDVGVRDLLPLQDLPHRSHRTSPVAVNGVLCVRATTGVHHCCERIEAPLTVFDATDLESVDIKDVIGPERSMQVVTKKRLPGDICCCYIGQIVHQLGALKVVK